MKKQIVTIIATTVLLFFISSCAKEDTTPITCPKGYTGADCKQQITPSKIRITRIDVLGFPCTKSNGDAWDLGFPDSGPELYLIILKGSTVIYNSVSYVSDANCTNTYSIIPNLELTNPNEAYSFALYDNDSPLSDDLIGGVIGTLYSSTNGFPTTQNFDIGGIKIRLTLEYVF